MPDPLRLTPVDEAARFLREKGWRVRFVDKSERHRCRWTVVHPAGFAMHMSAGKMVKTAEEAGFVTPKGVEEGAGN